MKKILLFLVIVFGVLTISATYTPTYRLLMIGDSISKLGPWYYVRGLMSAKHSNWVMVESDGTLNDQGTVELLANWATWVTPYIADTNGLWIRYNSVIHDINHPTSIADYRTNIDTVLSRFKRAVGSHIIIAPSTSADSRYSGYASISQYNDTLLSVANRVLGAGNFVIDSLYRRQATVGDSVWTHAADGYHFTNPIYQAMSVYIVDSTLPKAFATVANVQTTYFASCGVSAIDSIVNPSSTQNISYRSAGIGAADSCPPAISWAAHGNDTIGLARTRTVVNSGCAFDSIAVTAGSLPSGYTLNKTTGQLSFTPVSIQAKTAVTFTAYNLYGSLTSAVVDSIQVVSGCGPATVTSQPSSTTVTAPTTAVFSVTATGDAPLSYQWQRNSSAITGATASSYTTPATGSADNGASFRCVVSNACGTATSNSATLTVNLNPTLTSNKPEFSKLVGGGKDTLRGLYLSSIDSLWIGDTLRLAAALTLTDTACIFTLPAYGVRGGVNIMTYSDGFRDTIFGLSYKNIHITQFVPARGKAGDTVRIRFLWGAGTSGLSLKFGDSAVSPLTGYSDTSARAVVPLLPSGSVQVRAINGTGDTTIGVWQYGTTTKKRGSGFSFSFVKRQ